MWLCKTRTAATRAAIPSAISPQTHRRSVIPAEPSIHRF